MNPIFDEPPKNGMKGRVTATRTVWCADCCEWKMATENASAKRAEGEWLADGWVWTRKLGWLCSKCYRARVDSAHSPPFS